MAKWKMKDFKIESYRTGNQLRTGAEYAYKIIWEGKEIKRGFARKSDAIDFVRKLVKIQHEEIEKKGEKQNDYNR